MGWYIHTKTCKASALVFCVAASVLTYLVKANIVMARESATLVPSFTEDMSKSKDLSSELAVLSGGCFWGMQAVFEHVKGVQQVVAGYSGGDRNTARYEMVSEGNTGHAESVQIRFNPKQISYGQLLRVFFSVAHNPTELNRQGPDVGGQYRSAIFYTNAQQRKVALAYINQLNHDRIFPLPVVTQVNVLRAFYPAEGYHQDYFIHHPESLYIAINDAPKLVELKQLFPKMYMEKPVLSTSLPM